MGGIQVIPFQFDRAAMEAALQSIAGYAWLFEWGMYLLLLATLGIALWVFFDSSNTGKGDAALVPRIISMVGVFLVIPAFIFRFTGTADGIGRRVQLLAEPGEPFFESAINFNVNWLISGYGPMIAILALIGAFAGIAAMVIYTSKNKENYITRTFFKSGNVGASAYTAPPAGASSPPTIADPSVSPVSAVTPPTIISAPSAGGRPSAVKTMIDRPVASLRAESGIDDGKSWGISEGEVAIGRDAACKIALGDPKASGYHAKIKKQNNSWIIMDLGSSNGTFKNGIQITGQQDIDEGDLIKIGDTVLSFSQNS